jgi:hypothetical protein
LKHFGISLKILCLIAFLALFVASGCDGGDGGGGSSSTTDYSGTYYIIIAGQAGWTLSINQSGENLTFTMQGSGMTIDGSGSVSGNTATMTATITGMGDITVTAHFSSDKQNFTGTYVMSEAGASQGTVMGSINDWATYDVASNGIPKFVADDYVYVASVGRISKFRSGAGHDFSDDFESCRSMKHYYEPDVVDWSTLGVYSPVVHSLLQPFHPLFDRHFRLVSSRRNWQQDWVYFHDDEGRLASAPTDWTSLSFP